MSDDIYFVIVIRGFINNVFSVYRKFYHTIKDLYQGI